MIVISVSLEYHSSISYNIMLNQNKFSVSQSCHSIPLIYHYSFYGVLYAKCIFIENAFLHLFPEILPCLLVEAIFHLYLFCPS